jgi:hypothetical protein
LRATVPTYRLHGVMGYKDETGKRLILLVELNGIEPSTS